MCGVPVSDTRKHGKKKKKKEKEKMMRRREVFMMERESLWVEAKTLVSRGYLSFMHMCMHLHFLLRLLT